MLELEKRVETEFPNVPGTSAEKAAMLKSVLKFDKEQQEAFLKGWKQQNEVLGTSFKELGTSAVNKGGEDTPVAQLEKAAKQYQTDNKIDTYEKAYAQYLETPEGGALYKKMEDAQLAKRQSLNLV